LETNKKDLIFFYLEVYFIMQTKLAELKEKCIARLRECAEIYESKGLEVPAWRLSWDLKGRVAGTAARRPGMPYLIRLNESMLLKNGDTFVADTPGHELAHVLVFHHHPRYSRAHGWEWAKMMRFIGQSATRCHSMEAVPARVGSQYEYKCACSTYHLSAVRHRRSVSGGKYRCKKCGATLAHVK
jgi:SprT protein